MNGDQSGATGDVIVNSGATLTGDGTLGGATTINGTLSPGGNGVGDITFSDSLTFNSGSIFTWDISESSTSSGFDTISGNNSVTANSESVFHVIFSGDALAELQDTNNAFWNTPNVSQNWSMASIFGTGFDASSSFSNVTTNVTELADFGSFSINGTNLTWTAIPEPSTALAGILLAAGILRRRRS